MNSFISFDLTTPLADDFGSISLELGIFQPATATLPWCWIIFISNDDIVESTDTFSVVLSTNEPDVVLLRPSSAVVSIVDDDCKLLVCLLCQPDSSSYIIPLAVSVAWEQLSYVTSEVAGTVVACAVLTGQIERDIIVAAFSVDGTAIGWVVYIGHFGAS